MVAFHNGKPIVQQRLKCSSWCSHVLLCITTVPDVVFLGTEVTGDFSFNWSVFTYRQKKFRLPVVKIDGVSVLKPIKVVKRIAESSRKQ